MLVEACDREDGSLVDLRGVFRFLPFRVDGEGLLDDGFLIVHGVSLSEDCPGSFDSGHVHRRDFGEVERAEDPALAAGVVHRGLWMALAFSAAL